MPIYEFECPTCGEEKEVFRPMTKSMEIELCEVCQTMMTRLVSVPSVHGTRDGFGIDKAFTHIDKKTGKPKEINNWKDWEKAGYRSALDDVKSPHVKAQIKEKLKTNTYKNKKKPSDSIINSF